MQELKVTIEVSQGGREGYDTAWSARPEHRTDHGFNNIVGCLKRMLAFCKTKNAMTCRVLNCSFYRLKLKSSGDTADRIA